MQLIVQFNEAHSLSFDGVPCGLAIKDELSLREGIPKDIILLRVDGVVLGDQEYVSLDASVVRASVSNALAGGKGGFGAMLRSLAKQAGKKKTTDFGACRDLSGRRLRHVNDEIVLQKWKEAKDRGEEFDVEQETVSGLDLWFLSTPSWAEGIKVDHKKRFMKPRRKTSLCLDWVRARERHPAPEGAPAWWGCPRGRRCEFAHGEEELRGDAADELVDQKEAKKREEESRKRDAYLASIHARRKEEETFRDMISEGLQANKRAKIETTSLPEKAKAAPASAAVADILPIEGLDIPLEAPQPPSSAVSKPIPEEKKPSSSALETKPNQGSVSAEGKKQRPGAGWLKPLFGDLELTADGEVEGRGDFNTSAVADCAITEGKWYFEVELLSAGLMQIGWADNMFSALASGQTGGTAAASAATASAAASVKKAEGGNDDVDVGDDEGADGVGDDVHSWAYDGLRQKKWNKDDAEYGTTYQDGKVREAWKVGDVIGCLLEATSSNDRSKTKAARISFTVNGELLGEAFGPSDTSAALTEALGARGQVLGGDGVGVSKGLFPAISLEEGEAVLLNIGQYPFQYPPAADIMKPSEEHTGSPEGAKSASKRTKKVAKGTGASDSAVAAVEQLPYRPVLEALGENTRKAVPISNDASRRVDIATQASAAAASSANASDTLSVSPEPEPASSSTAVRQTSTATATEPTEPKQAADKATSLTAAPSARSRPADLEQMSFDPIDLESEQYSSVDALAALGLAHLKADLERRGLKAGGSLQERAERLFSVRGLAPDKIDAKLKAKTQKASK